MWLFSRVDGKVMMKHGNDGIWTQIFVPGVVLCNTKVQPGAHDKVGIPVEQSRTLSGKIACPRLSSLQPLTSQWPPNKHLRSF